MSPRAVSIYSYGLHLRTLHYFLPAFTAVKKCKKTAAQIEICTALFYFFKKGIAAQTASGIQKIASAAIITKATIIKIFLTAPLNFPLILSV